MSTDMYRMCFLENSYDRKNLKQWGRWVKLQLDRWLQARDMDAYTLTLLERLLQQLPQRLQVKMRELQHRTSEDLIQSVCAYNSAWVAEERSGRSVRGGLSKTPKPSEKTLPSLRIVPSPLTSQNRDIDPASKKKRVAAWTQMLRVPSMGTCSSKVPQGRVNIIFCYLWLGCIKASHMCICLASLSFVKYSFKESILSLYS